MTDEDNSGFDLSRRKVLGGVLTVGAASAATGAGTMALFSDSEESNDNTVQAGTLDLTIGGNNSSTLSVSDIAPGDSGRTAIKVNNAGSLGGSLDVNVSDVTPNDANPEPEQSRTSKRNFTIHYGSDNDGNQVSLQSELGGVANVEIDMSSDPVVITADLPYALDPSGDSAVFAFDSDNDGIEDFQLAVRDHDNDGNFEGGYDDASTLPSGSRNRNESVPSGYDVRLENGNKRFVVKVPAGDLADPFAITGQANLAAYTPSTSGSNLAIPFIPGFGYNNPPIAGTSSFDGHATKMVEIQRGQLRTLADMLDVSVRVSSDSKKSNNDTFVSAGKVNRLPKVDAESNVSLPSGSTKYVIVEYELSKNVGNAVQGDSVSFNIDAELNQEDSQ
ncbi:TasA family protein [Halorussus marinus]|uniref:TasA family protein n=1 Tax=Halorussus marinus TaxID=2505976 RepID=UPI0010923E02|nr:TasA family protein [Halorussus marinus]